MIKDNLNRGGVDLFAQELNYYSSGHKTKKWWKSVFFYFSDVAVVNSYLIYTKVCRKYNKPNMTQKAERIQLMRNLTQGQKVLNNSNGRKRKVEEISMFTEIIESEAKTRMQNAQKVQTV